MSRGTGIILTYGLVGDQGTQNAETVCQQRSRLAQTLNVPQRVRLGPSLAAALLDNLFEHPAGSVLLLCHTCGPSRFGRVAIIFQSACQAD